jgi:hypothetical protein
MTHPSQRGCGLGQIQREEAREKRRVRRDGDGDGDERHLT